MDFTNHATEKLKIYEITTAEINNSLAYSSQEFRDVKQNSKINIVEVKGSKLAVVISLETNKVVTIYTTDDKTIESRKRSGRWI